MTDQVKNLDWSARNLKIKGQAPTEIVQDCLDRIATLLTYRETDLPFREYSTLLLNKNQLPFKVADSYCYFKVNELTPQLQ